MRTYNRRTLQNRTNSPDKTGELDDLLAADLISQPRDGQSSNEGACKDGQKSGTPISPKYLPAGILATIAPWALLSGWLKTRR
jgi:hypothetical protein